MSTPQELKGQCILGAIYSPEIGKLAATYSRHRTLPDPANIVSASIYYSEIENKISENLKSIPQASGGTLPIVNKNIGAPLNTFLYGGLKPNTISGYLPLIKGPDTSTTFSFGTYPYNPQPFIADSKIGGSEGSSSSINTINNPFNTQTLISDSFTTIPSKPFVRFPNAPVLTTWNIWVPFLLPTKVKYSHNKGIVYPNESDYTVPSELQDFRDNERFYLSTREHLGSNMDDMGIVCTAQEEILAIYRVFPISADLAYNYPDNIPDHKPLLFYPPYNIIDDLPIGPPPRPIIATGSPNSGFQLHFDITQISKVTSDTNAGGQDGITIVFGIDPPLPLESQFITLFNLVLTPGLPPRFYYFNPAQEHFVGYPLNGPSFGSSRWYDVYVHFAGPIMLIGFDTNMNEWNVFNPISFTRNYQTYRLYPYLPAESGIVLLLKNIITKFQYGPIAFNNYDTSRVWRDTDVTDNTKYDCIFKTIWNLPQNNIYVDETAVNDQFQQHRSLNEIIDIDNVVDVVQSPTYYGDWRREVSVGNNDSTKDIPFELEWQKITQEKPQQTNASTKKIDSDTETVDPNELDTVISGRVVWNTTIEGPLFLKINSADVDDVSSKVDLINNFSWGDISDYMTDFTINVTPEGQLHSVLKSTATVTLKNFATTTKGRNILAYIDENMFGITLSAGRDQIYNFFQGVVKGVQTTYEKSGSTTILECQDVMSTILETTLFSSPYIFIGVNLGKVIQSCVRMAGLGRWYFVDSSPEFRFVLDNFNIGVPFMDSSLTIPSLNAQITDPIFPTIKNVTELMITPGIIPVFYWDAITKKIILAWRQNPDNIDQLAFLGDIQPENITFLPNDIHGVLKKDYTIETDLYNYLYSGILLTSQYNIGPFIVYKRIFPEAFSAQSLQTLKNANPDIPDLELPFLGYIGWRKAFNENASNKFFNTQVDLDRYGRDLTINYIRRPYSKINFEINILQPLKIQGQFIIRTFLDPNNIGVYSQNATDPYLYNTVLYKFTKATNELTAIITGEKLPPYFTGGII